MGLMSDALLHGFGQTSYASFGRAPIETTGEDAYNLRNQITPVMNGRNAVSESKQIEPGMDRRSFLKTAGGFAAYTLFGPSLIQRSLRGSDEAFLDDMAERSFRFFWEQSDPYTGLTRDRTVSGRHIEDHRNIGSIAATGFGLAAICIGAERNWVDPELARTRVRNTLTFFANHAPHEHGWFYHCMDIRTGERTGFSASDRHKSEVSSIDSALLLAGMLTARQHFDGDAEIARLTDKIYQRMDF